MKPTACDNFGPDENREPDQEPSYNGKDLLDNINNVISIIFIDGDVYDMKNFFIF